ncbi:bifunctional 5,10-methylenetetrahydrofolate dehydrogenase/5,10-methenyltetrahydrofolate cyclohydrolase [Patescibacteria group bacterium]|nr:bifunctional 5,10-methylenetetrahydrofolate dehydrogenase/5,10-methenyltetrahydrofolate cyclohydrolase [Patescibacteria group bacterium]
MLIHGHSIAESRLHELQLERSKLGPLTLSIVVMQEDAVTNSFLKIKRRVAERLGVAVVYVPTLAEAVGDGVILQLPLPLGVDQDVERNKIPFMKDVDGLSDAAFEAFCRGEFPPPPVARALDDILKLYDISYKDKQVVVVGKGRLVGAPAAELFRQRGAHVTVLERGAPLDVVREADILVLGAGSPGLITPELIHPGVVILDAGTSESAGKVVGDADPRCAERASLMTAVPGGVGPIAVVEIFANLFELVRRGHTVSART